MELGAKIKQARLEAGLSQRQLCGETITRNMLSQIENGSARPSMDTLKFFAARLGKSVSYFLEEEAEMSPREKRLIENLELLSSAEQAAEDGRSLYAKDLLEGMEITEEDHCAPYLNRKRLLLLARADPKQRAEVCAALPSLDEELLLRAQDALDRGLWDRAAALLEAAEDRETARWNFLRGESYLAAENYPEAARCYHRAEEAYPERTAPRLERCYREMEDFKQAYFYACKQK